MRGPWQFPSSGYIFKFASAVPLCHKTLDNPHSNSPFALLPREITSLEAMGIISTINHDSDTFAWTRRRFTAQN